MKKLVFITFSMVLLVGLMAGSIGTETFKLGVVDSNRVLLNYQKAIETDKTLKDAEKRLKEKLDIIGEEIRTLREKKTKSELFLEQPKIAELQKQIEQKTIEHQQEFERGRQALLEKNQELMTPIYKELEELIIKVGKEEKYDLIIDRQATLYFNEKYDITDELIKLINANAKKTEPKTENAEKPQTSTEKAK
ncbi:MAG: OmpH family outer membrane protein [Candidatus Poribacteria bacterium]|nr:OmpH family outer membrane protein [Candidatus Poribacteria bacterium]